MSSRASLTVDTGISADAGEVTRLRTRIAALSSLLAAAISSAGEEPRKLIAASLEAFLEILGLEFAYATFVDPNTGTSCVVARTHGARKPAAISQRIDSPIDLYLFEPSQAPLVAMRSPRGDAQIVRLRLTLHDEIGLIILGSARKDFPTLTEGLVLTVAASQIAIGLRAARLLSGQRRMARELDRKVAQQARALHAANEERQRALERLDQLQDTVRPDSDLLREHGMLTRGGLAPWQMRRATELMTANLQEHIPLTQLAARCGLSMRHFARAFRQSTGMPPHRWLLNHRVEHAKELLRNPAMSLAQIALACGFADQSHFTRTFTALVQVGPGLWRRMQSWRLPVGEAPTNGGQSWTA